MEKVVVFTNPYTTATVYDASTPDRLNRALLTILRSEFNGNEVRNSPKPDSSQVQEFLSMTPETITALPANLRSIVERELGVYNRRLKRYEDDKAFWEMAAPLWSESFEKAVSHSDQGPGKRSMAEYVLSLLMNDENGELLGIVSISEPESEKK